MSTLLLDSASLYWRSFYALPDTITAPDGTCVNAVRGFVDTIAGLVEQRGSTHVIACWDEDWRPQWRVDLIPGYKTHRVEEAESVDGAGDGDEEEEVPDLLGPQIPWIVEVLEAVGIPRIGAPGYEADDVIAALVEELRHHQDVDIASGDRDLMQLIGDRVTLLYTGGTSRTRGGRPWSDWGPDQVRERFGVPPERYAALAALRGDPSDGIPGVRGVGEKWAVRLLDAFGDIDGILAAARREPLPAPLTARLAAHLVDGADDVRAAQRVVDLRLAPPDPAPRATIAHWAQWRPVADPDRVEWIAETLGIGRSVSRLRSALAQTGHGTVE